MNWVTLLIVAVGLGMDAFAVSIAVGSRLERLTFRPLFRLSFHFGLFQFLMPVIGWLLGSSVDQYLGALSHWIAFGLLLIVGGRMIFESMKKSAGDIVPSDPTRKWSLVMLSVATSIDALAVGFGVALLEVSVWTASVIIGLVAAAMTLAGMFFGRKLGARLGSWAGVVGGALLVGIGVKTLIEHL